MARDNYWNRGRVEGVQQSPALDALERILGITSNVASNVQQSRIRRDEYDLKMIKLIAGNWEEDYSVSGIDEKISAVKAYKNKKMDSMTNQTRELLSVLENQMETQKTTNANFNSDMEALESLSEETGNWASDLYNNWELKTEEERRALIASGAKDSNDVLYTENYAEDKKQDFLKISKKYADAKGKIAEYDPRRVSQYHSQKIANVEMTINGALEFYKDGELSELEINTISDSVETGNAIPIDNLMRTQKIDTANAAKNLYAELDTHRNNIVSFKDILESGQTTVKWGNVKGFLGDDFDMDDDDDYVINLNDGSALANRTKADIEAKIAKEQSKLIKKNPTYERLSGKSFINMFNLSDDFLGKPEYKDPDPDPDPGKTPPKPIASDPISFNKAIKANRDFKSPIWTEEEKKTIAQRQEKQDGLIKLGYLVNPFITDINYVRNNVSNDAFKRYNVESRVENIKDINFYSSVVPAGRKAPDWIETLTDEQQKIIKNWKKKNYKEGRNDYHYNAANKASVKLYKSVTGKKADLGHGLRMDEVQELIDAWMKENNEVNSALNEINYLKKIGAVPKNIQKYIDGKIVKYGRSTDPGLEEWERQVLIIQDYYIRWHNWKPRGKASRGYDKNRSHTGGHGGIKSYEEILKLDDFYKHTMGKMIRDEEKKLNLIISKNTKSDEEKQKDSERQQKAMKWVKERLLW